MSVKERLIEFLRSQGISQRNFEQTIGVSNGYVNNIRVSIQPDKVQRIARHFPCLNTGWLLAGEGTMLKEEETSGDGITMSREIFDQISQLVDTVRSQQGTIANQQKMNADQGKLIADMYQKIDHLTSSGIHTVRPENDAGSVVAK